MHTVDVVHDSALPPARVFAFLSEHENLGPLLGARIRRVRDGDTERNGAGSVRELRVAVLPPFEETVTAVEPDRRIDYRISKGGVVRGHSGRIELSPLGSGTRVHWHIAFAGAVVPGLATVVRLGLQRGLTQGLQQLDARA